MYVVYLSMYKSGYFVIAFGSYSLWKFEKFSESKKAFFRYDSGHKESPEKVMQNFVEIEIGAFESCGRKFYKKNKISLFSPKIAKKYEQKWKQKTRFWSEIAEFDWGITKIRIMIK